MAGDVIALISGKVSSYIQERMLPLQAYLTSIFGEHEFADMDSATAEPTYFNTRLAFFNRFCEKVSVYFCNLFSYLIFLCRAMVPLLKSTLTSYDGRAVKRSTTVKEYPIYARPHVIPQTSITL
jgi:hypothetical protein